MRQTALSLLSGLLFGAGLAISGMADPARVRSFLDIFGNWDPTLAFVMAGALAIMAIAWRLQAGRKMPFAAVDFHIPGTSKIDLRLIGGAALFGAGWGIAGLCPGPAIADLALSPINAAIFIGAMIAGFAVQKLIPPA